MDAVDIRSFSSGKVNVQKLPDESLKRLAELTQAHQRRVDTEQMYEGAAIDVEEELSHLEQQEDTARSALETEGIEQLQFLVRKCASETRQFDDHIREAQRQLGERRDQELKVRKLREKLYRESFWAFWNAQQNTSRGGSQGSTGTPGSNAKEKDPDHTKLLSCAYQNEIMPFATDPVECWSLGVTVSPQNQQPVRVATSDGECAVSLPPYHEFSMRLRAKYEEHKLNEGYSLPEPARQPYRTAVERQKDPISTLIHNYPYNVPPSHQIRY